MKFVSFEWDESKNQSNIKKHGVSFEEARSVFYDEQAVEFYDIEHAGKEERFLLLGMSRKPNLLMVCHCLRRNDTVIRIISTRKATKNECQHYTRSTQ
jgi:uncharacterized DUF497 family protein